MTAQSLQYGLGETGKGDLSPDPLGGLIEVTRLDGLRSQLRSMKQRWKGAMGRMDSGLIAEKILSQPSCW